MSTNKKSCGTSCGAGEFKDGSVAGAFKCVKCDITNCATCKDLTDKETKQCKTCISQKFL